MTVQPAQTDLDGAVERLDVFFCDGDAPVSPYAGGQIRKGVRADIRTVLAALQRAEADVKRWHDAYEIAHDQAMANGAALQRSPRATTADDVISYVRQWLDTDDPASWGAFEKALNAALQQSPISGEGGEPVAWRYELAGSIQQDKTYTRWSAPKLAFEPPHVPEGSVRNLTPLYAAPPVPSVSGGEDQGSSLRDTHRVAETAVVGDCPFCGSEVESVDRCPDAGCQASIPELLAAWRRDHPVGEVINGERCTIHGPIARYSETCGACEQAAGR